MHEEAADTGTAVATRAQGGVPSMPIDARTRERLRRIVDDGTPPNTRRAYSSDMRYFWAWASAIGWTDEPVLPVPAEVLARFVADHLEGLDEEIDDELVARGVKARRGRHSINTIDRRLSAIASFHRAKGLPSPLGDPFVSQVMSKARRAAARRGERPKKKKAAVLSTLDRMLEACQGGGIADTRDRALLLFGWSSGGRRRSEVSTAVMEHLEEAGDSFVYHLDVTKTSQEGDGGTVPVTGRAARALRDWIETADIDAGPVFRAIDRYGNISERSLCDRSVALIVKRRARQAGLDPRLYAGHSLRSGFLTEAGLQGKSLLEAMALSRHRTVQVAAGYHQAGAALHNEAAGLAD